MNRILLVTILLFSGLTVSNAQLTNLSGSWLGKLSVGGANLRIVFNLEESESGYSVTMDSPDQGANGIPIGPFEQKGDSIIISAPTLRGEYRGLVTGVDQIAGEWTQMGRSMDLNLERQEEGKVTELNRPQEPVGPFPYMVKDVEFKNVEAGISLAGTLTIPVDGNKLPAVILVSGSGSQNRDEEIFGHKPFKLLADHLTRNGIAVLRYDDRGVGKSGGTPVGGTSTDFATDTKAALEYLMGHERIDGSSIGVIGHSEGGLIAQILASESKDVGFIISLAGPGTTGRQILLDQTVQINKLSGVPDSSIAINSALQNLIYDVLAKFEDPEKGFAEVIDKSLELLNVPGQQVVTREELESSLRGDLGPSSYPWFRHFILSDPGKLLPNIKCPVLALNGEKDCQVLYEQNLTGIEKGLKGNKDVTTKSFPNLNHMFQNCNTGLVNEYGEIEETMSPDVLNYISSWILERY